MSWMTQVATHPWLRRNVRVAFVPGLSMTALLEGAVDRLLARFRHRGDVVQPDPNEKTDLLLTTAPFAEPVSWRQSLLLTARRRFHLSRTPTVVTLVQATKREFRRLLDHFPPALARPEPDPADFAFP